MTGSAGLALAGCLYASPRRPSAALADLKERRFGPRVGVDRILTLIGKYSSVVKGREPLLLHSLSLPGRGLG